MTSWQAVPHNLAEANERIPQVIQGMQPHSLALRRIKIAKAHEFLRQHGISVTYCGGNVVSRRHIDNFDIRALRVNFERLDQIKVSNNTTASVRAFPSDNTSK